MRLALLLATVTGGAGCELYGGGDDTTDPVECEVSEPTYVLDEITVPQTNPEATLLGFDLDDDGVVDNQLARSLVALVQAIGLTWQVHVDDAVDRGELLLLASLDTCPDGAMTFATHEGTNPSPSPCTDPDDPLTCRQHLDGDGSFTLVAADPAEGVRGELVDGTFEGGLDGSGRLVLPLVLIESAPVRLELVVAHARLSEIDDTTLGAGTIGGAIPQDIVDGDVIPTLHALAVDLVARDCVGSSPAPCGCPANTVGDLVQETIDADRDCDLSLEEFRTNTLIVDLFELDVDTDGDRIPDALSIGVGVGAVAAQVR